MASAQRAGPASAALGVISVWLVMAIVLFLIHGQQEYCLTKQFILIFNTGLCICLVLAALTPCARGPGVPRQMKSLSGILSPLDQSTAYASRLLQVGMVIVYVTFWVWSAMQSSPETPGVVELSFLLDEEDLSCRVPHNGLVEESLTLTTAFMMFFTIVYVSGSYLGFGKRDAAANNEPVACTMEASNGFCACKRVANRAFAGLRPSRFSTPPVSLESGISAGALSSCQHCGKSRGLLSTEFRVHATTNAAAVSSPSVEIAGAKAESGVEEPSYSYAGFHFLLALSIMFITTQVTRWFQPDRYQSADFDKSWSTVSMKIGSGWSCGLLYLLYLLLPERCFPDPRAGKSGGRGREIRKSSNGEPKMSLSQQNIGHM